MLPTLAIAAAAAECCAQLTVLVSEVKNSLGQVRSLYDAADLDSTLVFN